MRNVFLFPGQGAQKAGMLQRLAYRNKIADAYIKEAGDILALNPLEMDTELKLTSTVYTQLCLFIAGVVSARQLISAGVVPTYLAGHSVGSFAAAVVGGAISYAEALQLVLLRGNLMQGAFPSGYGMLAVLGVRELTLQRILAEFNQHHTRIYISNVNSEQQLVVSGELSTLHTLEQTLRTSTAQRTKLLNVAVPSHCPLLDPVAHALRKQLAGIVVKDPLIPTLSNHRGRLLKHAEGVREDLWQNVARPVRWNDGITLLEELGTDIYIEMQPAGILSHLIVETFPEKTVFQMDQSNMETIIWHVTATNNTNF